MTDETTPQTAPRTPTQAMNALIDRIMAPVIDAILYPATPGSGSAYDPEPDDGSDAFASWIEDCPITLTMRQEETLQAWYEDSVADDGGVIE